MGLASPRGSEPGNDLSIWWDDVYRSLCLFLICSTSRVGAGGHWCGSIWRVVAPALLRVQSAGPRRLGSTRETPTSPLLRFLLPSRLYMLVFLMDAKPSGSASQLNGIMLPDGVPQYVRPPSPSSPCAAAPPDIASHDCAWSRPYNLPSLGMTENDHICGWEGM